MNRPKLTEVAGEVVRFGVVGAITSTLNYGVFFVLCFPLQVPYLVASAVGFIAGVLIGFPLNSLWTFRGRRTRRMLPYLALYLMSLTTSLGLLWLLKNNFRIDSATGNLASLGYTIVFNFLGSRFLIFRKD